MNRNRRILFTVAIVFTLVIAYLSYDMMRRTTRPGAPKQLPTRIRE